MSGLTVETVPEERVTKDLFLLFVMYLIAVPHSFILNGSISVPQFHRADTASQYLSAVKNYFILRFPRLNSLGDAIFGPNTDDWYSVMKYSMMSRINSGFITRGEEPSKKCPGIHRNLLKRMVLWLVSSNGSLTGIGHCVLATALVIIWLAVGRAGEIGNCYWEACTFDGTNGVFYMNWAENKTNDENL